MEDRIEFDHTKNIYFIVLKYNFGITMFIYCDVLPK